MPFLVYQSSHRHHRCVGLLRTFHQLWIVAIFKRSFLIQCHVCFLLLHKYCFSRHPQTSPRFLFLSLHLCPYLTASLFDYFCLVFYLLTLRSTSVQLREYLVRSIIPFARLIRCAMNCTYFTRYQSMKRSPTLNTASELQPPSDEFTSLNNLCPAHRSHSSSPSVTKSPSSSTNTFCLPCTTSQPPSFDPSPYPYTPHHVLP